jgi:hypothetical protein
LAGSYHSTSPPADSATPLPLTFTNIKQILRLIPPPTADLILLGPSWSCQYVDDVPLTLSSKSKRIEMEDGRERTESQLRWSPLTCLSPAPLSPSGLIILDSNDGEIETLVVTNVELRCEFKSYLNMVHFAGCHRLYRLTLIFHLHQ